MIGRESETGRVMDLSRYRQEKILPKGEGHPK